MLILDALVAGFIFKIFGEQGLWVLAITCGVTFLRLSGRLGWIFNAIENGLIEAEIEKEEE